MGIFSSLFGGSGKESRSFDALKEAESWFISNGFDLQSLLFSTYNEAKLTRFSGATILVGTGKVSNEHKGFAIEVLPTHGVVSSEIINPHGIATHHRTASMQAKMAGKPLIDVLVAMAAAHRALPPLKRS